MINDEFTTTNAADKEKFNFSWVGCIYQVYQLHEFFLLFLTKIYE